MNDVTALCAQVMGAHDQQVAHKFLMKYMDGVFPEHESAKEITLEQKQKELAEFTAKEVKLVQTPRGLQLQMTKREG